MNLELITTSPQARKHTTPILFVHGMWHAAWCWQEYFMPYFADQGYEVHALSLRGHGASESAKRFWRTSLNDYVSDLSQVIGQMEQKPILVGHSMGGLVIQKYIEKHEVPAAILLASIPPGGVMAATIRTFLKHPLIMLKINLTFSLYHLVSAPELAREAFFSPEMPEETVNKYFNLLQDEEGLC